MEEVWSVFLRLMKDYEALTMTEEEAYEIFQDTLNSYTKGDLDVALRIVQIATVQGYRECQWAINMFEDSEKRKRKQENSQVRVTEQQVATKKDLSDIVF